MASGGDCLETLGPVTGIYLEQGTAGKTKQQQCNGRGNGENRWYTQLITAAS